MSRDVEHDRDADGDDEAAEPRPGYVDGAWGRTANPNTVDGQLQNLAAFGGGLQRLSAPRRTAAKVVVWLILIGILVAVAYGAVGVIRTW